MEQRTIAAVVFGIAILGASWMFSSAWESTHPAMEKINVTGLAQSDFTSDLIVWRASFGRKAETISGAYPLMKRDAEIVRDYLLKRGVKADELVFDAIDIQQEYKSIKRDEGYERVFDGYRLWQGVRIESKNVDQVEAISREISELLNAGVELSSQAPEYYYSKLSELKVDLLSRAAEDGKVRAQAIAERSGGGLGSLRRADMGIFQITAQNSTEEFTWGGAFNTASKRKTASITVKMEFSVK
ncbi:MAG: SIMPL domain-containing protein [Ignavibacteriae bacterium]|nr:MAG: SIMPL domain-containing protein [Ignavibacteriota bacterium]